MANSSISVVPTGTKICRPFLAEVMIFSPEAGFKFTVSVERSCTPQADELWKLVFDLYKVTGGKSTQLVHVSYSSGTPVERKAAEAMITEGVKRGQSKILIEEVHPATKVLEGAAQATPEQKQALHKAMSKVLNVDV
ncbi:MAG: hypothetical protein M3R29_06980 [Verrucomicrobiota bacterium]|nr:hypothetical protein [Verrucomicrobiota bacterium]